MSSPDSAEHPNPELSFAPLGLGHEFADLTLLHLALTHRSWCAEHEGASNERLEFLGDAVLGMLVAERTYVQRPDLPEGQLAKIRASVVSSPALAEAARILGLGASLRLGRGEVSDGGEDKESILADALEAVIGAVYLDAGLDAARDLVDRLFAESLDRSAADPGEHDYKTRLQELVARNSTTPPRYVLTEDGPDHDKRFHATVEVAGRAHGPAVGTSKKRAEQAAARLACRSLEPAAVPVGAGASAALAPRPQTSQESP